MAEERKLKENEHDITRYKVIEKFENMRKKQRKLYAELINVETEIKEFSEVAKVLQESNPSRRCYRLFDDVLMESNVEGVLSPFFAEKDRLETLRENILAEIRESTENLKEFRRTYNIQLCEDIESH